MDPEPYPVDDLLELARNARAHPAFDPEATQSHSPAGIAADAERAAEAIRARDWRAAANLHYGLAGALGDAAHFLGIQLDPNHRVASRLNLLDALDRAQARRQWADLDTPVAMTAHPEGVILHLPDGSRVDAAFADAHDPVSGLLRWIWERHGAAGLLDALAELRVRPGDDGGSHNREAPEPGD